VKIAVILGTRPEIIKMSPVIRALEEKSADYFILHTGQHYSFNMDRVFFDQLKLPLSKYNLEVGSGSHAEQTARILIGIENVLLKEKPDVILVEGDTNTVLAGALAAAKLHIKIGHVEAGLRSYDRQMPEEINRILTDHCSDYLFAPTEKAKSVLIHEGIHEEIIFITGNTIVDAVRQNLELAKSRNSLLKQLNLKSKQYFLITVHRQENVDDPSRFGAILSSLDELGLVFGFPIIYPIHPRSRKMISQFNFKPLRITLIEPVDFLEFLTLENNAGLILTDSGGVQEESCILGIPCVTLRDNTERPETVEVGANLLAGTDPEKIMEYTKKMLERSKGWVNPFGDGRAGEKIISIIAGGNNG
jgi:UDP-N-acetylglucosamine 2-epimerase (non-hydrolysing)